MNLVKVKQVIRKAAWFIALLLILYGIQQMVNYLSYDYRGPSGSLVKMISSIGLAPDIIRFILWYLFQLALVLACIKLFIKKPLKEVGFNLNNLRSDIKTICAFFIIYPLIIVFTWFLIYWLGGLDLLLGGVSKQPIGYVIQDILAYGLLPGLGEEPLFRVFVIQFMLNTMFQGKDFNDKGTRIKIIILSAICFTFGHIFIVTWIPFTANYNVMQLVASFALGIFYAISYIKSKSILTAVVCHNYSDLVARSGVYILYNVIHK